jgi:hypothetical protein
MEQLCTTLEEAFWDYKDLYVAENPDVFPAVTFKQFVEMCTYTASITRARARLIPRVLFLTLSSLVRALLIVRCVSLLAQVFAAGRAAQPPFCNFRSSPRDMADWYLKYKRTLNSFGAILLDSTLKKACVLSSPFLRVSCVVCRACI